MKLRKVCAIALLTLWAVTAFAYTWGNLEMTMVEPNTHDEIVLRPGGTDDPQPDTLYYDDNTGNYLAHGPSNFYAKTRFTAPVEFELRSVYVWPNNSNNNTTTALTVTICDDNGGVPGTILTTIVAPAPIGTSWLDLNLTTPITFTAGSDFHIYYNIPGGAFPGGQGWWPRFDAASTTNRSSLSTSLPTWSPWNSDLLLRAGGDLAGDFLDLVTTCVYNTSRAFFMLPNTQVTFKADVENIGLVSADNYTFTWVVEDTTGNEVWRFENTYTSLAGGASVTHTADSAFTATTAGYYYVYGTAYHTDDTDHSNDVNSLEQGVDSLNVWYLLDDGIGDSQFTMDPNDGFGNSYTPTVFPCSVDSVKAMVGDSASCYLKIYQNDAMTGAPTTVVWESTQTMLANQWLSVSTGGVDIFEGSFTVSVEAISATTMKMDDSFPNAASNANMVTTAVQLSGGWGAFEGSDPMARAYVTPSSATPPFPVIDTNLDTIDFGEAVVGETEAVDLIIYNRGGQDPLTLTAVSIGPPDHFSLERSLNGETISAGDSVVVEARYTPQATGDHTASLVIINNTSVSPYFVRLLGTGIESGVEPHNGATPIEYALNQNHPNPFNPTTTIEFAIPTAGHVELAIFNVLGNRVANLVNTDMTSGNHSVVFDAAELGSGIYFYRLTAGNYTEMKKMVLMK
jgi:hypothetical protein